MIVFGSVCGNSSVVEHRLAKAGVASSNLVSRSIHSSIAQLVEQSAVNRSVVGSSPTRGAILFLGKVTFEGVSPSGKAVDSDSTIQRFESFYPCQFYIWFTSSVGRAPDF